MIVFPFRNIGTALIPREILRLCVVLLIKSIIAIQIRSSYGKVYLMEVCGSTLVSLTYFMNTFFFYFAKIVIIIYLS